MESLSQQRTAYICMHGDSKQTSLYAIKIPVEEDSKKEITCKSCGSDFNFPAKVKEGHGSNKKVFYRISEPEYALRIYPITTRRFHSHSSWCVMGSTIYNLGGRRNNSTKNSRKVYCFHTDGPEIKWKRGPSMINGRFMPFVIILGGKIYVLGGVLNDPQPWGEVFDPCLKTWEPLPPPPFEIVRNKVTGFSLDNMGKIFVDAPQSNVLYSFDVTTKSWQVFVERFSYGGVSDKYVVVGKTLYWLSDFTRLNVYDLNQQQFFSEKIPLDQVGEIDHYYSYNRIAIISSLLHLGGDMFYLIWVDAIPKTDYNFKCIHCTKFRVSKSINSKGLGVLTITLEPSVSYLADGHNLYVNGLLA